MLIDGTIELLIVMVMVFEGAVAGEGQVAFEVTSQVIAELFANDELE